MGVRVIVVEVLTWCFRAKLGAGRQGTIHRKSCNPIGHLRPRGQGTIPEYNPKGDLTLPSNTKNHGGAHTRFRGIKLGAKTPQKMKHPTPNRPVRNARAGAPGPAGGRQLAALPAAECLLLAGVRRGRGEGRPRADRSLAGAGGGQVPAEWEAGGHGPAGGRVVWSRVGFGNEASWKQTSSHQGRCDAGAARRRHERRGGG